MTLNSLIGAPDPRRVPYLVFLAKPQAVSPQPIPHNPHPLPRGLRFRVQVPCPLQKVRLDSLKR